MKVLEFLKDFFFKKFWIKAACVVLAVIATIFLNI